MNSIDTISLILPRMDQTGAKGLANFFLIDQSLTQVGGHHFDYVRLTAQAAESLGREPIIGTHKHFQSTAILEKFGQVVPVFRKTTYSKHSLLAGLREIARASDPKHTSGQGLRAKWNTWRNSRNAVGEFRKRSQHVRCFAEDCDRFFRKHTFHDGDLAFFVTMSELDFMGLATYLANHPRTMQVTWHVQFHFSMFYGRPPEFEHQKDRELAILESFQSALARIPYHDVKCYTTSDELAQQYNRMQLIPFDPLSYPVNPQFFEHQNSRPPKGPLELTVAGGIRREKGQKDYLFNLLRQIGNHLTDGRLRINVQGGKRCWLPKYRMLIKNNLVTGQPDDIEKTMRFFDHPLDEDDYLQLIERSDIGLLYYDSRRYYSRRAGILGEFLAAGKPVIVPAGCWLSEQIAEPLFQHAENSLRTDPGSKFIDLADTKWSSNNVPMPGGVITFDRLRHPFECSLPVISGKRMIAVEFNWHWPLEAGNYCQIECISRDQHGYPLGCQKQIVGQRIESDNIMTMFEVPENAERVSIRFSNAFLDSTISVSNVCFHLFNPKNTTQGTPKGAVGVIVSEPSDLAGAVDEIVAHYEHYLSTAVDFAQTWAARHDPMRTLDDLLDNPCLVKRSA